MYQLKERRMIELDVDLAKHYLKYNTYEVQRKIRPNYVDELKNKMIDGRFRFGEIAFVSMNGNPDIMMNGQHVCSAVIESNIVVPCTLEKYTTENDSEVSNLFRNFDILQRSIADYIASEHYSLRLPWAIWLSKLIVSAATIEKSKLRSYETYGGIGGTARKNPLSKNDKTELLKKYIKEGNWIYKLLILDHESLKMRSVGFRRAIVAFMIFKTIRIDENDGFKFWRSVRDGEYLPKDSPQMRLRNFLIQNTNKKYSQTTNHEIAYRIILAWNAFRTNSSTNLAYRSDRDSPVLK